MKKKLVMTGPKEQIRLLIFEKSTSLKKQVKRVLSEKIEHLENFASPVGQ